MNLSVESRVKAHISTPYIDSDGRGTINTYAADYADCMKSPAEFLKIQTQGSDDIKILENLEARHAEVIRLTKEFRDVVLAREVARNKSITEEGAALAHTISPKRADQRREEQQEEIRALDQAYHCRMNSEKDMATYERLLKASAASKLRLKEVELHARHQKLRQQSAHAQQLQQNLVAEQQRREEHVRGIEGRMIREASEARRVAYEAEAQRQVEAQMARDAAERQRQERLHDEVAALRLAADLQQQEFERQHMKHLAQEAAALQLLTEKKQQQVDLEIQQLNTSKGATYERLHALQLEHEAAALRIKEEIARQQQPATYIEMVVKVSADDDTLQALRGLEALRCATLRPAIKAPTCRSIGTVYEQQAAPKKKWA